MANEYLKRTPTSTGNRKVWTWSAWLKRSNLTSQTTTLFSAATSGTDQARIAMRSAADGAGLFFQDYASGATQLEIDTSSGMKLRDFSSWMNVIVAIDTTKTTEDDRVKLYTNGVLYTGPLTSEVYTGGINYNTRFNQTILHTIGWLTAGGSGYEFLGELADIFFIDGQALTPDVFGFYKEGNGYISAGSTQSTDFRPGQWVPKTPRIIKAQIERNGGFGVNGFYLPMNDSNNFGADFHCEPNSIIKLQEDLPQPKVSIASTAQAGLAYTDVLRADPYAANLVLALPFVSGGLESGLGDYSHLVRNTGIAKTITVRGNVSTVSVASSVQNYYGSSATWDGSGDCLEFTNDADFRVGSGDFTIEGWFRTRTAGTQETYFALFGDSSSRRGILLYKDTSNVPRLELSSGTNSASTLINIQPSTSVVLGDWHHIAVERHKDTASIYLNGVAIGIATNVNSVPGAIYNNTTDPFQVGAYGGTNVQSFPWNGQISDLRFYKGVAKYKGGFDVPKPYTPVGIATWRAVPDCTANNFATWTSNSGFAGRNSGNVRAGGATFTDGNLTWYRTENSIPIYSTINVRTGKYYWEYLIRGNTRTSYGIVQTPHDGGYAVEFGNAGDYAYMHESGQTKVINGSSSSAGSYFASVPTVNDIIGVAFDASTGQLWFSKNGTFGNSGDPAAGTNALITGITTDTQYNFAVFGAGDYPSSATLQGSTNFGQNPTFSGQLTAGTFTDSNGKGLFKYQPPTGFLALCEDNLPTPAISNPGEYFKTVLYTGSSSASQGVVGVGFTPDLVWIKHRTSAGSGHIWTDSVRGAGKAIFSFATNAEDALASTGYLSSFDNDGFSLSDGSSSGARVKADAAPYVAWCWRAGAGTTSTNTDGSIQSVVSVNQTAGFSIVSYTGNNTAGATVGHGLGKKPSMIILKSRSLGTDWIVQHKSAGTAPSKLILNATNAVTNSAPEWNNTLPNSSTFTIGPTGYSVNNPGATYIAYCWAEIEGFSKFGSYVGNGNADGPFVYCGFKPAWVMIKRTDTTQNWPIIDSSRDSVNVANRRLFANLSDIEDQGIPNFVDLLSNGFKCRDSNVSYNASGGTYIFAAFAESAFSYSNAK